VGGTNPSILAGAGGAIDPRPDDNFGVMGAGAMGFGAMGDMNGMLMGGDPFSGGDIDPGPDDVGMGNGGNPFSYPPVTPNQSFITPTPESTGGSCGTGRGGTMSNTDCTTF